MKTYSMFYMVFVLVFFGCSKTGGEDGNSDPEVIAGEADYTLLMTSNGQLESQRLNATAETLLINTGENKFGALPLPDLTYKEGSKLTMYHAKVDCSGEITTYDFSDQSTQQNVVFNDIPNCAVVATAIVRSETKVYVGYVLAEIDQPKKYMVRVIDGNASEYSYVDVPLDKKPIQFILANNRLFILTFDEEITDENGMVVIDMDTNSLIYENNLGYNVRQLLKNKDGNLLICYDGLHTVFNSATLGVQYVNYGLGSEPNFSSSQSIHFDLEGKLYFERPTGEELHPNIPAIYDFNLSTTYLFIFENFLTQEQVEFDYEIGDTTMVGYDTSNNLLLIGYRKTGDLGKGGLLRIKLNPDPELVDQIGLDGIPIDIYLK
ncbi:MAG: hypothetical protein MUO53_10810 [Maribacter sp.]|nr:hypothetical protein [Maribacter sp.]